MKDMRGMCVTVTATLDQVPPKNLEKVGHFLQIAKLYTIKFLISYIIIQLMDTFLSPLLGF
jgi:hypothetical protein